MFERAATGKMVARCGTLPYLSCSKLRGYFDPGGNRGFSSGVLDTGSAGFVDFAEFPAFPDLTMPLLGGMRDALKELARDSDRRLSAPTTTSKGDC